MPQENYGFNLKMPEDIDFMVLSNEDINFIANLVAGTNDVHSFALPYPASVDLFDETITVYAIEFIKHDDNRTVGTTTAQCLQAYLSMLDQAFAVDWEGNADDDEDENLKAHFAGPIFFGHKQLNVTAVASVEGTERRNDRNVLAMYIPPIPLDLITPLYIQFVNMSGTVTLATNAVAAANYTAFEAVQLRVWFTTRKLTAAEKSARSMQLRFQRIDS